MTPLSVAPLYRNDGMGAHAAVMDYVEAMRRPWGDDGLDYGDGFVRALYLVALCPQIVEPLAAALLAEYRADPMLDGTDRDAALMEMAGTLVARWQAEQEGAP